MPQCAFLRSPNHFAPFLSPRRVLKVYTVYLKMYTLFFEGRVNVSHSLLAILDFAFWFSFTEGLTADLEIERRFGNVIIAGVDEAGRGPLAV